MSTFYFIKHSFKLGKADQWWATLAELTAAGKMSDWAAACEQLGFINHTMLATGVETNSFCLWEAAEGKTGADMQSFIDGEHGPSFGCLSNEVFPINLALSGTPPFPRRFSSEATTGPTAAAPYTSELFLVQHVFKAGKAPEWWATFGALASEPKKMAEWTAAAMAEGYFNHCFMPTGQTSDAFCIWEAKAGTTAAQFQSFIDSDMGPSFGAMNNTVLRIDVEKSDVSAIEQKFQQTDLCKIVEAGYAAFAAKDAAALSQFFTEDCEMSPIFPVSGWAPVKGFKPMMEQFGAMDSHQGLKGFAPTVDKTVQSGNMVLAFETVKTIKDEFKGLAIFHFNDEGRCYLCVPYHDSAKLSSDYVAPAQPATASAYPTNKASLDLCKVVEAGYKSFAAQDMDALAKYFTSDCEMNPNFPVSGWEPVKGFKPMMEQFGAMHSTDAHPGVKGFTPTVDSTVQVGDAVLVFENIKTEKAEFKALAIHHFNEEGKCYLVAPYHDSAKLSQAA